MLTPINRCVIGSHVSFSATRVPNALFLAHHKQYTKAAQWLRLFTTTVAIRNPTQSSPRKLDVFISSEDAIVEPVKALAKTPAATEHTNSTTPFSPPSSPLLSPILKPITTHHNLDTYLSYHRDRLSSAPNPQTRQKLITSTVHLGTRYEYLIQSHLQSNLGFDLTRIGGKGDGGVDLIGTWMLPIPLPSSPPQRQTQTPTFRILLQAKRISATRKPMPALMRELDGTILSASSSTWISAAFVTHNVRTGAQRPASCNAEHDDAQPQPLVSDLSHLPTLGILVTTRPMTVGIEKAMASSRRCLMYVCLEEVEDLEMEIQDGGNGGGATLTRTPVTRLRQMAWNAAASRAGLEGYDVVAKYSNEDSRELTMAEAMMMFQGQPLRPP